VRRLAAAFFFNTARRAIRRPLFIDAASKSKAIPARRDRTPESPHFFAF
jgi:hypothetical protein